MDGGGSGGVRNVADGAAGGLELFLFCLCCRSSRQVAIPVRCAASFTASPVLLEVALYWVV